jgi:small subunit ribosomal protein S8
MMTDPIADMLTRIRNAQRAGHKTVEMPWSKLKLRIAEILCNEEYIERAETVKENDAAPHTTLRLTLKYHGKQPAIQELKRESKPGFRMYRKADEIPTVVSGYGIAILSTSRGLMTSKEAKKLGVGGEILCSVF